jgi:hypothetical protein
MREIQFETKFYTHFFAVARVTAAALVGVDVEIRQHQGFLLGLQGECLLCVHKTFSVFVCVCMCACVI